MHKRQKRILLLSLCASAFLFGLCARLGTDTTNAQRKTRLLFVTESKGFHHQVLPQAEEIMKQLGAKNGFEVTVTQKAEDELTPDNLKNLDAIVFYTTGELPLSDAQKTDLKRLCFALQPQLDRLRAWPIANSAQPALYLKPLVEHEKKSDAAPNLKSAPAATAPPKSLAPGKP